MPAMLTRMTGEKSRRPQFVRIASSLALRQARSTTHALGLAVMSAPCRAAADHRAPPADQRPAPAHTALGSLMMHPTSAPPQNDGSSR